MKNQMLNSNN